MNKIARSRSYLKKELNKVVAEIIKLETIIETAPRGQDLYEIPELHKIVDDARTRLVELGITRHCLSYELEFFGTED